MKNLDLEPDDDLKFLIENNVRIQLGRSLVSLEEASLLARRANHMDLANELQEQHIAANPVPMITEEDLFRALTTEAQRRSHS